jgi:alpha-mannosidase
MALDLLDQILPHVANAVYPLSVPLTSWKVKESDLADGSAPALKDKSWADFTVPSFWGGYDRTAWFRTTVTVPQGFSGMPVGVVLDLPEALLFVNGKPYSGLDANHQEVLLTEKAKAGQTFRLAIQAYSGRTKDVSHFKRADLVVIYPTAKILHSALSFFRELEKMYGSGTTESKDLRELIRRTLIYLKYFKPEGEEYPNAIGRALNFLHNTLETEFTAGSEGLVHLLGQSHLDLAWLWTIKEARRKVARTFSSMVRLLDEYPEFRYTQSQAQLYEFLETDYPSLAKEVRAHIESGRWEVTGSTWVETDCNIPSGESLVRQIMLGKRYFKSQFGVDTDIFWVPDSFGYTASLPQIMKKTGIRYFFTTKLAWNDTTKFPYNSFWWEGIDGSRILSHMPPVGLEGNATPKDLRKAWLAYQQKEITPSVMMTYGFGDGGGGVTKKQILTSRFMRTLPTLPQARISSAKEFFESLAQAAADLPVWKGELYLEKHRGALTTLGWIKKANRTAEIGLYTAELLATLAALNPAAKGRQARYPGAELDAAWKTLLTNQFHDIICGTCIPEVFTAAQEDFARISELTRKALDTSLAQLRTPVQKEQNGWTISVFNSLPWKRSDYVEFSVPGTDKSFRVTDDRGQTCPWQLLGRSKGTTRLLCYIEDIGALSGRTLSVVPQKGQEVEPSQWRIGTKQIESPLYRIRLDGKGSLASIYERRTRREILAGGTRGNVLQAFTDKPKEWEAWDIDAEAETKQHECLRVQSVTTLEQGPLRVVIEIVFKSDRGSVIKQRMMLYHKLARIDFATAADWHERQTLLKVAFPLNVRAQAATYEIQFGSLERASKAKTPQDKAKFEVSAQQWADLSDKKFGVTLVNDSKYAYDIKENVMRLTLLRSPHYPHELDPSKQTDSKTMDQGPHQFRYGLVPHHGDWRSGGSVRSAREFNQPLLVLPGVALRPIEPLLRTLPNGIFLSTVKKAEDGQDTIIRLYEGHGASAKVTLEFGYSVDQATECDLLEQPVAKLKSTKGKLALKFGPYEIKTLRLKLRPTAPKKGGKST